MNIKECPYCGGSVSLVDSNKVYGKSFGLIYLCDHYPECDAYVGVHKGTEIPLGTMANEELRRWRKNAHYWFDKTWKEGSMTRKAAYNVLMTKIGLGKKEAHIAKFNIEQCKQVIEIFRRIFDGRS